MAMTFKVASLYDIFSHMCFTINSVFSMPKVQSQQTRVHATIKHNAHSFHSIWLSIDQYMYIGRLWSDSRPRPATEKK